MSKNPVYEAKMRNRIALMSCQRELENRTKYLESEEGRTVLYCPRTMVTFSAYGVISKANITATCYNECQYYNEKR